MTRIFLEIVIVSVKLKIKEDINHYNRKIVESLNISTINNKQHKGSLFLK